MKRSTLIGLSLSVATLPLAPLAISEQASPLAAAARPDRDVIVIMRDQLAATPVSKRDMSARSDAARSSQAAVTSSLQAAKSGQIRSFKVINAFAARVSAAEAAKLAANPAVKAVVPDRILHRAVPLAETLRQAGVAPATAPSPALRPICNTLEPEALQLMNVAFPTASTPQAQTVLDGNGVPVRGKGVTVAWIADGLDTTIPGFTRPDGTPVFVDYQNFSGDPASAPTAGGEAFGDASSIAAQDMPNGSPYYYDISQFVSSAHALPSPCKIRIRGVAPDASLVGLNVFSNSVTTTSNFVQAIDYAVSVDHVDVINESFGGNPYPDTANDPITLADSAAIGAGVTVVASTGDAGTAGTLGSPGTSDDGIIAAGASTQFRYYQQVGFYFPPFATGYLSNNISSLSSGGFATLTPRTVDVVAPGDLSWALCSTNTSLYQDCTNYRGVGSPIESFGGTSESAPLTSGTAALVIQAYRSTHGGASPTPAQVKQIIMSSATDLGALPQEQGAGLVNALAAVQSALSINGGTARGNTLSLAPNAVAVTDLPNTAETETFTVTNNGTGTRVLAPVLESFTQKLGGADYSVTLNPGHDSTFIGPVGEKRDYVTQTFTVPSGSQHLDASIAWQTPLNGYGSDIVRIILLDPKGREAAYSLPQGAGNGYGHVDVVNPLQGQWTAVVFTANTSSGYAGNVQLSWAAEHYARTGSVSPATITLAPGASTTITAKFSTPANPGDFGSAIKFVAQRGDAGSPLPSIPVTIRSLVPVTATGGTFTGTLTGGNGRAGSGPAQTFSFVMPSGLDNVSLSVGVPDNLYLLEGFLVDPNGTALSVEPNIDALGNLQYGFGGGHYNPQAGLWRLILLTDFYSSGNQTSAPFSARIGFNNGGVYPSGVPNSASTQISASGSGQVATIGIANNTPISTAYFIDARTSGSATVSLANLGCPNTALPFGYGCYTVPTQTSSAAFVASSNQPLNMDAYNDAGINVGQTYSPDVYGVQSGNQVTATSTAAEVAYGTWFAVPSLVGPYGPSGAPSAPLTMTASASIAPYDPAVTADGGDYWADTTNGTSTFNPVVLTPGGFGSLNVTFKPTASQVGQTISGVLYIDTYNPYVNTGDELVAVPYSYTVTP